MFCGTAKTTEYFKGVSSTLYMYFDKVYCIVDFYSHVGDFLHPLYILTGDHFYKRNKEKSDKEQMITALPEIMTETIQEEDEFMVLACDGIW